MKEHSIYKGQQLIGEVVSENMNLFWEEKKSYTDKEYEDILYPQVWYGSGYVTPEFRVKDMHRVVCAMKEVQPNDSAFFVLKLLVNDSLITSFHEESLKHLKFKDVT